MLQLVNLWVCEMPPIQKAQRMISLPGVALILIKMGSGTRSPKGDGFVERG